MPFSITHVGRKKSGPTICLVGGKGTGGICSLGGRSNNYLKVVLRGKVKLLG